MVAIKIDYFIDPLEFKMRIDERIRQVKESKPMEGYDAVLVPGSKEFSTRRKSMVEGIPAAPGLAAQLRKMAVDVKRSSSLLIV